MKEAKLSNHLSLKRMVAMTLIRTRAPGKNGRYDLHPLYSAPCCRDQLKDVGHCDLHLLGQPCYLPSRPLLTNPITLSHTALHTSGS